ncbi:MAG: hypothetical protein IPQ11_16715 [Bacteroidetes bacterium]|nr:hypothetical protein [Bacteroidota bacterium]
MDNGCYEASSCWYRTNNICTPDLLLTTNCILPNGNPISINDLPGNIFIAGWTIQQVH